MSYLTLLFPSQTQGMVNSSDTNREAEHEEFTGRGPCDGACSGAGDAPDDYLLPAGIVSMEHWLDLNA